MNAIFQTPIIKEMQPNLILEGMCSVREAKRDRGIALWNHTLKAYEEKGSERENQKKARLSEKGKQKQMQCHSSKTRGLSRKDKSVPKTRQNILNSIICDTRGTKINNMNTALNQRNYIPMGRGT